MSMLPVYGVQGGETDAHGRNSEAGLPQSKKGIPYKAVNQSHIISPWRIVFILIAVSGIVVGGAYVLKRTLLTKRGLAPITGDRIQVVDMKRISQKVTIFLIAIDGFEYVLTHYGDNASMVRHQRTAESERKSET